MRIRSEKGLTNSYTPGGKGVHKVDTLFFVDNGIGGGVWWLSRSKLNDKRSTSRQHAFFMPEFYFLCREGGGYIEEAHVIYRTF